MCYAPVRGLALPRVPLQGTQPPLLLTPAHPWTDHVITALAAPPHPCPWQLLLVSWEERELLLDDQQPTALPGLGQPGTEEAGRAGEAKRPSWPKCGWGPARPQGRGLGQHMPLNQSPAVLRDPEPRGGQGLSWGLGMQAQGHACLPSAFPSSRAGKWRPGNPGPLPALSEPCHPEGTAGCALPEGGCCNSSFQSQGGDRKLKRKKKTRKMKKSVQRLPGKHELN